MPITKRKSLDQIVIEPDTGHIFWRESTVIEEDNTELFRSYHRSSAKIDEVDSDRMPAKVKEFKRLAKEQFKNKS